MALPLAHAGHWVLWVLYAVPVLIVLGSIVATVLRDRRQRRLGDGRSES
jgi:cytochrome c-type biogenesis protein CcmH/NrfF